VSGFSLGQTLNPQSRIGGRTKAAASQAALPYSKGALRLSVREHFRTAKSRNIQKPTLRCQAPLKAHGEEHRSLWLPSDD
jgi:hypothetical protein